MSFHWSKQEELGSGVWQFRLLLAIFSILGSTLMGIIVKPITFVFFIIAGKRRQYSRDYLRTIADFSGQKAARNCSVHRHFQSFAVSMVDKMSAWAGRLNLGNIEFAPGGGYENLVDSLKHGRGVLAICSHLGNIEMLRALGTLSVNNISNFHIIAIVYFNGTARFHEMIRSINGDSIAGILSVSDIGPQTIIMLKEFADNGGMIVIAGDRTAPNNSGRTINQ
ncbi:MAG: hypothetical protein KAH21_10400, partial [Spirochaetaceae bacterium]|nr:hypothetical protein [Spirochaetaceae bacterium]